MRSNVARSRRTGGVALGLMAAITISACGSSSDGSSTSTIATLTSTNFVQLPTVPSTTTSTLPMAAGQAITGESTYTIQSGDFPSTIARRFKVQLADLLALNGWTLVGQQVTNFPAVGTQIKIPAGATMPGASTETTVAPAPGTETGTTSTVAGAQPDASTTTAAAGASTTTVAGGGDNCKAGSYTITADDTTRIKVADKFNVTVEQLDAANTGTSGYSAFYPGLKIVIPAKAGC